MAPNNGLANSKPKDPASKKSGTTTILEAGTVESRGMGTNVNSRRVISDQIHQFLRGEGRLTPRAEVRGFFTVWTFVTRLPGPTWVDHHPGYLMRGMAYFPLSGSLIGTFVSVFYDLAHYTLGLPLTIASVISEAASLWITGCFHEDGLADSADGIGGGWSRDQILKIMTDTRLGTYGCAILLLYIIAKLELLSSLGRSIWAIGACSGGGPAIIVTHTMARLTAPLLIKMNDYVDEQGPKYKFYSFFVEAKHLVSWHRVLFAIMTSFAVTALAYGAEKAIALIVCVFVAVVFSGRYANYLLGGVMGDYLGATICVTEVYLLTVISLMPYIQNHMELVKELTSLSTGFLKGTMTQSVLMDDIMSDDRKMALLKFVLVGLFTTIWCSCVGHPPVFVRTSVAAKGNSDEIQISLANDTNGTGGSDKSRPKNALGATMSDPEQSFTKRYNAVRVYLDSLAKPVGSLGTLEDWAARLAALQGTPNPSADKVACLIFAGDHGVAKDRADGGANCSAYPQAVTRKVLEGLEHKVAGASVLAKQNNVFLRVIDVGLADLPGVDPCSSGVGSFGNGEVVESSKHKINGGTKNFVNCPAMTQEELDGCMLAGRQEVQRIVDEMKAGSSTVLVFGEVGIGNTTVSSALIAALTGEPVDALCGGGATKTREGDESDSIVSNKISIIKQAIAHHGALAMLNKPALALKNVGGTEIAAIVGGILEASERNIAVIVDGFIVTVAAMLACNISPKCCRILLFATKSTEVGQSIALDAIHKVASSNNIPPPPKPALNMNLRMGEATGALMAVPILRSAAAILCDLATLEKVLSIQMKTDDNEPVC